MGSSLPLFALFPKEWLYGVGKGGDACEVLQEAVDPSGSSTLPVPSQPPLPPCPWDPMEGTGEEQNLAPLWLMGRTFLVHEFLATVCVGHRASTE